ncbi:MAG: DNA repair protein RadA [Anaerolineales bacterium]|nr:DNA repair protein RadA [Anaerolineales bacterium]
MAKARVEYVCQQCGRKAAKALGKCPQCGSWNTMVAEVVSKGRGATPASSVAVSEPRRLTEIEGDVEERLPLHIEELARVLGGGVVPGSVVLIGGDPGIGKSTLLIQMTLAIARVAPVLYVSGEESERQLKARSLRLISEDQLPQDLFLLTETHLEGIIEHIQELSPRLVVIDSIQTMQVADLESGAGSISQVRECATRLQALAKSSGSAIFLVGHVTKEGAIAGPKVLEHIVDTVLYLEGDAFHAYRLLRSVKNRFGATSEVGVFEMTTKGLLEVPNPSEAFLKERVTDAPGSTIAVTMEGTRPLLVEVQGLTSMTTFGNPRRTANGVDFNRLLLTVAVLTRRVGIRLADQDVFINIVGGLRVNEPAVDLAMALAITSSVRDKPIAGDLAVLGEIGLSGEVRTVPQLAARLKEASNLGFSRVIAPQATLPKSDIPEGMDLIGVRSVREAIKMAFNG